VRGDVFTSTGVNAPGYNLHPSRTLTLTGEICGTLSRLANAAPY